MVGTSERESQGDRSEVTEEERVPGKEMRDGRGREGRHREGGQEGVRNGRKGGGISTHSHF